MRERELKLLRLGDRLDGRRSLPMRERELKPRLLAKLDAAHRRSPCGSVN